MKALTIHQPFASLVMAGAKPYEFRYLRPPAALIGQRIVIHASAQVIRKPVASRLFVAVRDQVLSSIVTATLLPDMALPILARAWEPSGEPLPLSAGLGTVIIGEPCRAADIAHDPGHPLADDEQDLWAWPMLNPIRWPLPVRVSGSQGFWHWPHEVLV
ncbi:ASCH domain-containing protein [Novosphingobium soli]|uniref:ASCH domain-containing protein n=1 Tax=Novosphingobium soli TaxID=574956 RepID=A0ABV6D1D4_9SPHN